MVRYFRLLRLFFRTELQYELEYRLNLLLEIVQTIVVTATSVGAILVLFSYTTVLNGSFVRRPPRARPCDAARSRAAQ